MAYVYTSDDHYLSPSTAFVALSLIDILRGTVGSVPEIVAHLVKVSSYLAFIIILSYHLVKVSLTWLSSS